MSTRTFTVDEIEDYLTGWLLTPVDPAAEAAIANGLSQLRCEQDGIEATSERLRYYVSELTEQRKTVVYALQQARGYVDETTKRAMPSDYKSPTLEIIDRALATLNP